MKKIATIAVLAVAIAIGCKSGGKQNSADKGTEMTIAFSPKSGSNAAGTATFTQSATGVVFTAKLSGLEPGVHAIHIHEKSDCSAPDASSAGGHWNPTFQKHGKWGSPEHHRGDIGNFPADQDGNGTITMSTSQWCIGCGDPKKDILGKSVIVHTNPDDYTTQPTGNAGGRVACSAIIK
ncbi:MAG TPA: superoxide dismutase family protein [Flavobacterium sp.]|jgi:Cu-Zn family superoxide dismutase